MTELNTQDRVDILASYLEVAFKALDEGDSCIARAALRRMAQYLLDLNEGD